MSMTSKGVLLATVWGESAETGLHEKIEAWESKRFAITVVVKGIHLYILTC